MKRYTIEIVCMVMLTIYVQLIHKLSTITQFMIQPVSSPSRRLPEFCRPGALRTTLARR